MAVTAADTLILSQNLLQHLNKFKLDIVSNALSLPDFNHHRAGDDAMTCGLIMTKLMEKLEQEQDVHTLQAINPAMVSLRSGSRITDRQARHIILFAKSFADVYVGEALAYVNSLDCVAVAINQGSFARAYNIGTGNSWRIRIEPFKGF